METECKHEWGKWVQYTENGTFTSIFFKTPRAYSEERQRRHCKKCNKAQDEEIPGR